MSDDRLLADSVDIGLIHLDHEGRIRLWNRWIAQRATRPAAEAEGLTLVEAFGKHIDPRSHIIGVAKLKQEAAHVIAGLLGQELVERNLQAVQQGHDLCQIG